MIETPSQGKEREAIVLVMVLVLYGSLFPFEFVAHDPSWSDWRGLLQPPTQGIPATDLIGNVLLFVPYGALLAWPRLKRFAVGWITTGALFAMGIQYLQFWFAGRDPSGLDALLNLSGILVGLLIGTVINRRLQQRGPAGWRRPHWVAMATGLMGLWVAYRWFPLVPSLDVQNFKNGLKPLLHWEPLPWLDVWRNFAGWVVFMRLGRYSLAQRLSAPQVALACTGILLCTPLFADQLLRPTHVIGLAVAMALYPLLNRGAASLGLLVLILASSIILSALSPFELGAPQPFEWLPFSGSLTGDMLSNIAALIEKCFLYGTLLFFLRYLGASRSVSIWGVCLTLLALEWLQRWIPTRTPEITDPLLALLLAYLLDRTLSTRHRDRADPQPRI